MAININLLGFETLDFSSFGMWKLAAGAILLFLIIYLIKPKPTERVIPSLMFLMSQRKKGKFNSFLRKLFRDPLFFLQLLLLIFICFALLQPFFTYKYDVSSENTVLVLDVSASMQADDRFDDMMREARSKMSGMVSVVLVKSYPEVLFEDQELEKARELLDLVKPTTSTSNIMEAMKMADGLMANKTGKIIVISDFVDSESGQEDIIQYKHFLEGKGRFVEFVIMPPLKDNIGFVGSEYSNNRLTLYVKNFNDVEEEVTIKGGESKIELKMEPDSIEIVKLELEKGLSTVKIDRKDDFMLDNEYYLNIPTSKKMKVLFITNDESTYLGAFLTSSPYIDLEISNPPEMKNIDHDIVVMGSIMKSRYLSKITDDVHAYVEQGGAVVVQTQDDIRSFNLDPILPVEISSKVQEQGDPKIVIEQDMTRDIAFPPVNNFAESTLKDGAVMVVSANGFPLISTMKIGQGNVMYYNIPEETSEFKFSASYPIFWSRALRSVSNFNDFNDLNRKTTEAGFDEKVGFYQKAQKTIAVNLVDEKESYVTDSSATEKFIQEASVDNSGRDSFEIRSFDILMILIPLIILLVIWEIGYVKYRGDI